MTALSQRIQALEREAKAERAAAVRVIWEGEPTAEDLASGDHLIQVRYVPSPAHEVVE